jgi:apolipoprotein N-acyltransferase
VQSGFTPGQDSGQFEVPDLDATMSVSICFEDTFAGLVRKSVGPDTSFLVNITNDGWFGEAGAQWQHAAAALFRSVETGLPLVRCANTGLTCWYDAHGRRRDSLADPRGSIYGPGFLTFNLPFLSRDAMPPPTFFRQHGDCFGLGCVAFAGLALLLSRFRA